MNITDTYKLLNDSSGDWALYNILADLYEERGLESLARAVRWMIKNKRRPFKFVDDTYRWYSDKDLITEQSKKYVEWVLPHELVQRLSPYKDTKEVKKLVYASVEECIDELSQVPDLKRYSVILI